MGKRRGRPVTVGRAATFSMRLRPDLRQKLEESAAADGTSLTEQIERRIAQSFEGTAVDRAALRVIAELMRQLDGMTGRRWADDPWSFDQLAAGIAHLLRQWRPEGEAVKAAVARLDADTADQLGRYLVNGALLRLDFSEAPDDAPWKRDLGSLISRRSGDEQE
jgi:hypothetical protein